MKPDGHPGKFDDETASVIWATIDEAEKLISKTTNPKQKTRPCRARCGQVRSPVALDTARRLLGDFEANTDRFPLR
jgi:hypothetical protein